MLPAPDPFWLQRWHSLSNNINDTINIFKAEKRFGSLLNNLLNFGRRQFFYFYFGFSHELLDALYSKANGENTYSLSEDQLEEALKSFKKNPLLKRIEANLIKEALSKAYQIEDYRIRLPQRLVKDYDLPPAYVLRTIIDQVSYDYEIIKRALHQRLYGTPNEKETLCIANYWGQKLLDPLSLQTEEKAKNGSIKLLESTPTVISYFNRSPFIRVIPYDNVALVGIPLTTTEPGRRRDLLAVGHELGHYVYWHGQTNNQSIRSKLGDIVQGEMPYIKSWIEEIFADVFGLVISRQLAMLPWAIEMIADNPPNLYVQDSQTHPIDAVRPTIYIHALEAINEIIALRKKQKTPWVLLRVILENEDKDEDTGNFNAILNTLDRKIQNLRRIAGGHENIQVVNRLNQNTVVELTEVKLRIKLIITRIVDEILIPQNKNVPEWENQIKGLKKGIQEVLPPGGSVSRCKFDKPHKAVNPISIPLSPVKSLSPFPLIFIDLLHSIINDAKIQDWYKQFETLLAKPEPNKQECEILDYSDKKQRKQSFEAIRDKEFSSPLEVDVWRIVFTANGWTSKGPETGPTGDGGGWEADWRFSAVHR